MRAGVLANSSLWASSVLCSLEQINGVGESLMRFKYVHLSHDPDAGHVLIIGFSGSGRSLSS